METDGDYTITPVVFRKWKSRFNNPEENVMALFPTIKGSDSRYVLSYEHIGQHGDASWFVIQDTVSATPEEYKDLKEELESVGYKLKVYKRWTRH